MGEISLGGQTFRILPTDIGDDYFGRMMFDMKVIQVHPTLKIGTGVFRDTVRHELLHAALAMGGLNHILKEEQEEAVVRCVENLFFPAWDGAPPHLRELKPE